MTELFIDNQAVILPKEFSLQLIEENPFFTQRSKMTLDITLSLKNETNAKIYKHYNRLNNKAQIATERTARLVADNHVLLSGTEIILEITDVEVKLQFVAGKSELNFLTSDKKINELDLGDYNDRMYAYIPLLSTTIDSIAYGNLPWAVDDPALNHAFINFPLAIWQPASALESPYLNSGVGGTISPQPLFYHIVNQIIRNFGFSIGSNVLQTTDFQYLYLINRTFERNYSKMLPNWTVSEFFEEIEKLFNVIILVDEFSRKANIIFKSDYYNEGNIVFIDKVLDSYSQKIDSENRTDYSLANTGYDLEDDDYFKFQNIDPKILKYCEVVHFRSFDQIFSYFISVPNKNTLKNKIFVSDYSNTKYIFYLGELGENDYYPKKVNAFEPIRNNPASEDIDIELKIKPAPMTVIDVPVHRENQPITSQPLYYLRTQVTIVDTIPYNPFNIIDIQDVLEGDSEIDNKEISDIFIVFFNGKHTIYQPETDYIISTRKVDYPVPFVDFLCEYNMYLERKINENNLSLRLNHPNGFKSLYEQSIAIDTTKEYTFNFISTGNLNTRSIFVFKNKKFACKDLKYKITPAGIDKIIEGTFYAIS